MKKLPIGIQTFSKIIEENYYYADKTELITELAENGSALAQIKEKKYYEKYLSNAADEVYLIGAEFSRDNRNIVNYEWEKISLLRKT